MDPLLLHQHSFSNVYLRIQCIERNRNYRFLIVVKDENTAEHLAEDLGFESSFHRENNCYCVYSLDTNVTKDLTEEIIVIIRDHGYRKSLKFFTERAVNRGGVDDPYMPDPDVNLLENFCAKDVEYEINYVYTRVED